ncbi:MAG: DUF234 domain-containing protein [Campylobacterota bacterium]
MTRFWQHFPHLGVVDAFEYWAIFGGVEDDVEIKFFDNLYDTIEDNLIRRFDDFAARIQPSFLLERPYSDLLWAATKSDAKKLNVFKKSGLGQNRAQELLEELIDMEVLTLEPSREPVPQKKPGQKLKKEFRGYVIQPKVRFVKPFYRFFFRFVLHQRENICLGSTKELFSEFSKNIDKFFGYPFEQLTTEKLAGEYDLIESGTYWDRDNEYDLYAVTEDDTLIVGECKYKDRRVCKNELTKLQKKCEQSGLQPDIYLLASKSGFSKELESMKDKVILYDMNSFKTLAKRQ